MLREPGWWYASELGAPARLLSPLAALYGRAVERRYRQTTPYRSRLPVICVGNFTAGGTGKTPLALLIARELAQSGEVPIFLTRGYGGNQLGPRIVVPAVDSVEEVGDEALLLAMEAKTIVARDRGAGARAAERMEPRPTVLVMDDGLQNPSLAKDLAIAVIDGQRGLGNGRVLPAGPLRAPLAFQLGLVHALLINGPPSGAQPTDLATHLAEVFAGPILKARTEPDGDISWLRGAPVIAFAGIGNTERFFRMLAALGAHLLEAIPFADHHPFSEQDAEALLGMAAARNATLATTRKDWVRLAGFGGTRALLRDRARAVGMRLALGNDHDRLLSLVRSALDRRRADLVA